MTFILQPGLSVCDPGGQHVFLDVAADRYFALTPPVDAAFRRLVNGTTPEPADAERLEGLAARGILCPRTGHVRPSYCLAPRKPRSDRDCFAETIPPHGLTLKAIALLGRTITELRVRSLEQVLASVTRAKQMAVSHSKSDRAALHAAAFARADRIVTSLDRCLPRSIALARSMISDGLVPELVLGVKLRPFEAHCWVQYGDLLVSDHLGTVEPFTPILVL